MIEQMNSKLLKLAKMILKLSQTETDKGVLIADSELAEGVEVFIESEDGELTVAPDGDYETETQVITVADGKVVAIKEKEVKEEETTEETVVETEEVETETEPETEQVDETETLKATIAELEATIEALKAEIAEKDEKIAQLEEQVRITEKEQEFSEQTPAYKETQEKTVMSLAEAAKSVYNK